MGDDQHGGATTPGTAPELFKFKAALHSPFVLRLEDGRAVTLTLVEVNPSGSRPGWESFSLIFDGPDPAEFMDGLFEVAHPEIGSFPVFVVAVNTDGDGQQYQAVFNRRST